MNSVFYGVNNKDDEFEKRLLHLLFF